MTYDLLFPENGARLIRPPGGELDYIEDFDAGTNADRLFEELATGTPWRQESLTVWGRRHVQPRLVSWYGDAGRLYTYSGVRLEPIPWTTTLLLVRSMVERTVGTSFNSVLLNYYRDENDSMGFHSDNERELGDRPVIASLSLGAERTIVFKSKIDKSLKPIRLTLQHGSLLVMRGLTQQNWVHGILKESRRVGPRVNLTFRRIISN